MTTQKIKKNFFIVRPSMLRDFQLEPRFPIWAYPQASPIPMLVTPNSAVNFSPTFILVPTSMSMILDDMSKALVTSFHNPLNSCSELKHGNLLRLIHPRKPVNLATVLPAKHSAC